MSLEARAEFAEKPGFTDPLLVQFGRFLSDLAQFDFGESIRKARPALDVVLEAFPTTLKRSAMTMTTRLLDEGREHFAGRVTSTIPADMLSSRPERRRRQHA